LRSRQGRAALSSAVVSDVTSVVLMQVSLDATSRGQESAG
jgi:hypothetical protein